MPAGRRFTPSFVSRIPLMESGQSFHWDSAVIGFGLVVGKTTKSYVAQFKGKRVTIGRADLLTLDEARDKAAEAIRQMAHGEDPRAQRIAIRSKAERLAALTLRVAMEETLAAKAMFLRPKTLSIYRTSIELYLGDWLDRPLVKITANDISTRFAEIAEGRDLGPRRDGGKYSSRSTLRGGRIVAAKAMKALRVVWRHSKWRHTDLDIPECPTGVLTQVSRGWSNVGARTRTLSDIATFVAVAQSYPNRVQGDLVQFLLFSGFRMTEGCRLRWDEVDLDAGTVDISGDRMKAHRRFHVPLTHLALEVLQRRLADGRDSSGYVFIGRRSAGGKARDGWATVSKAFMKVLREAVGPFSCHDLRRTYTSLAIEAGCPLFHVEALTAHKSSGVVLNHYHSATIDALRIEAAKIDRVLRARLA